MSNAAAARVTAQEPAKKVNRAQAGGSTVERLDRKLDILARIEAAERALETAVVQRDRIALQVADGRNAEKGHRWTVEREQEQTGKAQEGHTRELRAAEDNSQRLQAHLDQAETRIRELRGQLDHLRDVELPACGAETNLDELAAHCARVASAATEVRALETRIAEQRQSVHDLEASMPSLAEQDHQREKLLARVAMGQAQKSDLEEHDDAYRAKRIEVEKECARITAEIAEHQQTINGLQSLMHEAVERRDGLNKRTPQAVEEFLLSDARRAQEIYLKLAIEIRHAYAELCALNQYLMEITANKRRFITGSTNTMQLPAFDLPGGVPTDRPEHDRGAIFRTSDESHRRAVESAAQALGRRLEVAGISSS